MLENKKDDIFLARWINDELSSEELIAFRSHPEYEYYIKLKKSADALQLTEYDVENELAAIKSNKRNTIEKKSNSILKLWPYFTAAASIAILIGVFLFNNSTSFSSNYGEQLAVSLPDGSEMILNAKSNASFDKKNWENNRTVNLEGEAYFKVKKGSKFTVSTINGDVSVLGTQFNVQSFNSFFEVLCYEGKVNVTTTKNNKILTAGKAFRNIEKNNSENWAFTEQKPSWIDYTSSFRSIPIKFVLKKLEEQFNIQIETTEIDTKVIYTGTFPNDNKEIALKTVFSTLDINYKISVDGKTVVLEK